jgi:methyl-accepting chemotaxis protein
MRSDSRLEPTTHSILASFANPDTGSVRTEAVLEAQKEISDTQLIIDYLGSPVYSSWGSIPLDGFSWTILAEINQEEIMGPIWSLVLWTSLIVLIFVAGILLVAVLFARSIARPLAKVAKAAGSIARGVLDVELKINQGDEIGQMAGAMQGMIRSLKEKGEVIASMAAGDLSQDIPLASDEDELGKNMRLMSRSLNEILSNVDQAVIQMASGADQVATASQDLSQGATEQASSLEEISASANEVGGQAEQNSNSSSQATSLAKKNTQGAREGNQLMSELLEIMAQITQSADETKKIVKTIDDIAFQVNLLALNANVEAARAGKYGRGFAVVAEEVRTLAVRSAQAVKETTAMVEESQARVVQGNEKAQVTGKQLTAMVGVSTKVSDILEEIATASKEQALAITQVNKGLEQIDQVTQSNTASAEESASASEELASQAQQLKTMLKRFTLKQSRVRALPEPEGESESNADRTSIKDWQGFRSSRVESNSPTLLKAAHQIRLDGDFEDF